MKVGEIFSLGGDCGGYGGYGYGGYKHYGYGGYRHYGGYGGYRHYGGYGGYRHYGGYHNGGSLLSIRIGGGRY